MDVARGVGGEEIFEIFRCLGIWRYNVGDI